MGVAERCESLPAADRAAVEWLLESEEPAVRRLTLTQVLGLPADAPEVLRERRRIYEGPVVRTLLSGQQPDGGFGVSAYGKWTGTHWRLLSLVELDVPPDDERLRRAFEHELAWIRSPSRLRRAGPVAGRYRRCGSQEGAALAIGVHLGMADDERVGAIARDLIEWQWPDGGWNCDIRPGATHSSFHESLKPLWSLNAYGRAAGDEPASRAADRAAEFFLVHRLFRSERTGESYAKLLKLRFPAYWHYDILEALLILTRTGRMEDERTVDARDELQARRLPDGRWRAAGRWWRPPGARTAAEVVDWGKDDIGNRMVSLRALTVLRSTGS